MEPGETAKSARIVKDMLRRGFVLLVEVGSDEKGPIYRRAHDFDENTTEYIVAGMSADEEISNVEKPASSPRPRRQAKAASRKRVPASSTSAVAVARTAGG
jgi:hypothetical protein